MHDCYYVINKTIHRNANIRWWQFWRKKLEVPTPCNECYEDRYGRGANMMWEY